MLPTISHVFFMEGTIALEPARLFMIGYILHNKGFRKGKTDNKFNQILDTIYFTSYTSCIIQAARISPMVFIKMRTVQIYLFFLNWKLHARYLATLLGGIWFYLLVKIKYVSYLSVINGLIVFFISYGMLKRSVYKLRLSLTLILLTIPVTRTKNVINITLGYYSHLVYSY